MHALSTYSLVRSEEMCDRKTQTKAMLANNEPQMKVYMRKGADNAKHRNKKMKVYMRKGADNAKHRNKKIKVYKRKGADNAKHRNKKMKVYMRKGADNAKHRNEKMSAIGHPFQNPVSLEMNMSVTFHFNLVPMYAVNLP